MPAEGRFVPQRQFVLQSLNRGVVVRTVLGFKNRLHVFFSPVKQKLLEEPVFLHAHQGVFVALKSVREFGEQRFHKVENLVAR